MKDFLANRPKLEEQNSHAALIVKGLGVLEKTASAPDAPNPSPHGKQCEAPEVDLNYDAEGRVKEIRITCRCGEIITLRCVY